MQNFLGRLGSLARRFGINPGEQGQYTNPGTPAPDDSGEQGYPPPGGQYGARRADEGAPSRPTYDQYSGDGYTSAGARPRNVPEKGPSLFTRIKEKILQQPDPPYAEPPPGKVVPISSRNGGGAHDGFEEEDEFGASPRSSSKTLIQRVYRMDDAQEIILHMINGDKAIINMEEIDDVLKQRMVDMISGAAFALGFTIKRFSFRNYYVYPEGEDVINNIAEDEPQGYEYRQERPTRSSKRFY